jgi:hypothetical protein
MWDAMEEDVTGPDLVLSEVVDVDVKMRYADERPEPDLILTLDRQPTDVYVLAELVRSDNEWTVTLTGWITHERALDVAEPFHFGAKEKVLVPREALRSMSSLPYYVAEQEIAARRQAGDSR